MPERVTCYRCRMGFLVKDPRATAELLRCPECNLDFWSGARASKYGNVVRVGITAEETARVGLT